MLNRYFDVISLQKFKKKMFIKFIAILFTCFFKRVKWIEFVLT